MEALFEKQPDNKKLEVVISFDTTGSMYPWLDTLRGKLQAMVQRLKRDIPDIKIAIFAHGDYCDTNIYVTKWIDFTSDETELCKFVQTVARTSGGDTPECYELVLRQVHTKLSWTTGSSRVLVMIGDSNPHEPHEACNTENINWRDETEKLSEIGVAIYAVQCGGGSSQATEFYETISSWTQGKHLHLQDFVNLFDTLTAVCFKECGDQTKLMRFEEEVREQRRSRRAYEERERDYSDRCDDAAYEERDRGFFSYEGPSDDKAVEEIEERDTVSRSSRPSPCRCRPDDIDYIRRTRGGEERGRGTRSHQADDEIDAMFKALKTEDKPHKLRDHRR